MSVPVAHWGYRHNMMENTMVLWIMLSIIWIKNALQKESVNWLWLLASAATTWAAFMTKGMSGLFPLAGVFAFWLVWRNFSFLKMLSISTVYFIAVAGGILILFAFPASQEFMNNYLFIRTLERINNTPVVASRLWIIGEWFAQVIVPIVICLAVALVSKNMIKNLKLTNRKTIYFFLLIGALGLFPLMLTKVQRSFYLLTSLPFFALALAIVILPYFKSIANRIQPKTNRFIRYISLSVLSAVLIATVLLAGKPKRDFETLKDVEAFANYLGDDILIQAAADANMDWTFKAYLMRKHQIQFVYMHENATNQFVVARKDEPFNQAHYCVVDIELANYVLFEKCN
jgi:hypothetical protein